MTSPTDEKSQIRYARLAGLMFLLVDVAYLSSVLITAHLEVPGNFVETAHRIMASELLYRIGLANGLIASLCTVFLAIGLYVAVKPIDKNLALLAFAFRLAESTIFGVLSISNFIFLRLRIDNAYVNAFDGKQLSAFVDLHSAAALIGFNIAFIFFGMGSTLFFYLLFKGNYIPRILSALGLFGSVLVPIIGFGNLITPEHATMLYLGGPIGLAEILVGLWLLLWGVSVQQVTTIGEQRTR